MTEADFSENLSPEETHSQEDQNCQACPPEGGAHRPPQPEDPDYRCCRLCPRRCGADRYWKPGFCGMGTAPVLARAALHFWEEPCISGRGGSGAVFFSGCTLRCVYCQNYRLSHQGFGKAITNQQLSDIFLRLAAEGAENINLVTPTHFLPDVIRALDRVRHRLSIPVVMNCGGYERPETIRRLSGYVDVYLPDLKYKSPALSEAYSKAPDYFQQASEAIQEMVRQAGVPDLEVPPEGETLKKGVIIRHMVLPSARKDSLALLSWIKEALPEHHFLLSLMSQYTPFYRAKEFHEIDRRVTSFEYDSVLKKALELDLRGYMQERTSAREEYTPPFDLTGVP